MAKTVTDADLDRAAAMGGVRLDNEGMIDAPVFMPPEPPWAINRRAFFTKQREAMSTEVLMNHYVELLVRASALLEFMHHNVGMDYEWPLTIMGDSDEVESCFGDLVGRMEAAVGCLTEV
jgi:hypothetical protein